MIVAYDRERTIGADGKLPWEGKMASDMRRFRELTLGHSVIMGRTTAESLRGPLKDRQNIVLSRMGMKAVEGFEIVGSLSEAYTIARDEAWIIGGGKVYEAALPDVNTIYATEIEADVDGDVQFPAFDMSEWNETSREIHDADERNIFPYSFVTFDRK